MSLPYSLVVRVTIGRFAGGTGIDNDTGGGLVMSFTIMRDDRVMTENLRMTDDE